MVDPANDQQALGLFLSQHEILHRDFATAIGVDARTVRRWLNGESPVPGSVVIMIELFDLLEAAGSERWRVYFKAE